LLYRGARVAASPFRDAVLNLAAGRLNLPPCSLRLGPGGVWPSAPGPNRPLITFRELAAGCGDLPSAIVRAPAEETPTAVKAHGDFNAASAIAAVTVDRWTGRIKVDQMFVATACGPVLSPLAFIGQVEGGAVMALGMAVLEHIPDEHGFYLHKNLDGYMVPTIADAPVIDVLALEELDEGDFLGPRGIGEISINVAVPAIANAISDAIGAPIRRLPVTPSDVLRMLACQEKQ
jgi:CO/xanthine dehydrogenase Mo-binding subunit